MQGIETIQKQNGTTPQEAIEAAKPYYCRVKIQSTPDTEKLTIDPEPETKA